jgi:hypothetical protein
MSSTDTFAITSIARVDPRQIRISGDLILKGQLKETIGTTPLSVCKRTRSRARAKILMNKSVRTRVVSYL